MKQYCKDCHFLVAANAVAGLPHALTSLGIDDRQNLGGYLYGSNRVERYLGCRKGVWGPPSAKEEDYGTFALQHIHQDREDSCFFVEYQDGMLFETADELQKLHYQNRHLQKGYRDTQEGLKLTAKNVRISAIALAISAAFSVLNFFGLAYTKQLTLTLLQYLNLVLCILLTFLLSTLP